MGEWSKKIGEVGEEIVGEFFGLIGWQDSRKNLTLPCLKPEKHGAGEKSKQTHGIDYLFSYESQLEDRTLNHLVVSVKYSSKPYPASPSAKFKDHFFDLTKTLECFKNSEIRSSSNNQFTGIDNARNVGVLFWLSNDTNSDGDVIKKVAGARGLDDYSYESLYLIDNHRFSFIYDSIKFLRLKYPSCDIDFFYPSTGRNFNISNRDTSGKILPVEFVNSSLLPFKIINEKGDKIFSISVIDSFNMDHLKRVIGLAQEMTSDLANSTVIMFPDYDRLKHENDVYEAKQGFKNKTFTNTVTVTSFRSDFRSLGNE